VKGEYYETRLNESRTPIHGIIADVKVHAHTFRFVTPAMTDEYKIPNPCTSCHQDKPTSWWATEALHRWPERPPWRLE